MELANTGGYATADGSEQPLGLALLPGVSLAADLSVGIVDPAVVGNGADTLSWHVDRIRQRQRDVDAAEAEVRARVAAIIAAADPAPARPTPPPPPTSPSRSARPGGTPPRDPTARPPPRPPSPPTVRAARVSAEAAGKPPPATTTTPPPEAPRARPGGRRRGCQGAPRRHRREAHRRARRPGRLGRPHGVGAVDGPSPADSDDPEVVRQHARYVDVTQRIEARDFRDERPERERSPSPPPKYDRHGARTNTREHRMEAKLREQRSDLIGWLVTRCPHLFRPPPDWRPTKKRRKLWVPEKEYPGYNFIGLVIGPRGNTQKRMQRETNTRIAIRGKGSIKEGANREPGMDYNEDEPLHVLITGDTDEEVDRAAAMVAQLLKPVDETFNEHKRAQLRELALINGTLRDIEGMTCHHCGRPGHTQENCPEKDVQGYRADVALVTCKICGDGGHPTVDCPMRNRGAAGAEAREKMSSEYQSFLSELGVDKVPGGLGGAGPSETSRPGLGAPRGERPIDPAKLYVGSLADHIDDARLRAIFESHGDIESAQVVRHPDGAPRVRACQVCRRGGGGSRGGGGERRAGGGTTRTRGVAGDKSAWPPGNARGRDGDGDGDGDARGWARGWAREWAREWARGWAGRAGCVPPPMPARTRPPMMPGARARRRRRDGGAPPPPPMGIGTMGAPYGVPPRRPRRGRAYGVPPPPGAAGAHVPPRRRPGTVPPPPPGGRSSAAARGHVPPPPPVDGSAGLRRRWGGGSHPHPRRRVATRPRLRRRPRRRARRRRLSRRRAERGHERFMKEPGSDAGQRRS